MRIEVPRRTQSTLYLCLFFLAALLAAGLPAAAAPPAQCTNQCGVGCPTGCYPASTSTSFSCSRNLNVQTSCKAVSGAQLSSCEDHCPDGYYVKAARSNVPSCTLGYGGIQMDCALVAGQSLNTCQTQCPDGYFPASVNQQPAVCGVAFGNWQTRCDKVAGTTVNTCDDDCPTGFYPASTQGSSISCGWPNGPYGGIQTQCRQTTGPSVTVCGASCPSGYYLQETRTGQSACSVRYNGVQSVCSTSPQRQCDEGCPAGFYVARTERDGSCLNGVRTICEKVAGSSYRTCQHDCADGYYVTDLFSSVPDCSQLWSGFQIACRQVGGNQLRTCEDSCPAGFYKTATYGNVGSCGNSLSRYKGLQTVCDRIAGDLLRTCEDKCPTDYYPTGVNTNVGACQIRHFGIQTECTRVQGPDLITCGDTCPPNYFPGATSTNFRCGSVYGNQQTACSKTEAPRSKPTILQQPQSVSITQHQPATLTVVAAGQTPLSFQWYKGASGDRSHPVATNGRDAKLVVYPQETTSYWVLVTNSLGEAASETATVTVTPACIPPSITGQPQPVTIQQGQTATLRVTATGTNLQYQWFKGEFLGSSPVTGATTDTLQISPPATSNYNVRVSNGCGTQVSSFARVTVEPLCTPAAITTQPQPASISQGDQVSLSVVATGTGLTYQWYRGVSGDVSQPVDGGNTASLSDTPQATTSYWVRVSAACGDPVDSATATVTVTRVCVAPRLLGAPQPVTIEAGQSASLTVTAEGTSLAYQWYEGQGGDTSQPLRGETRATLVATPTQTTTYWVLVFNECGSTSTPGVTVTVNPACVPPAVSRQLQSVAITAGQSATLTIAATGTDLTYQWYEGAASDTSRPVAGATEASLTVTPNATTSYWVRISNGCGSVDSATASVTVSVPCLQPAILSQPQPAAINAGQTVTLSVSASGTNLFYQWYEGPSGDTSQPVQGETSPFLTVAPASTTSYWVRVSNQCGLADSSAAQVSVSPICIQPAITSQPQSVTILEGQSASLVVSASGTSPTFQWFRGSSGDTSSPVQGGVATSLVVAPTTTTSYWARASNACGQANSQTATVTVSPLCVPPSITSQPLSTTITEGQSATLSVGAAGTSPLSYQWYRGVVGSTFNPVPGGTGPSVTVAPTTTTSYWVQISNACGSRSSVGATVTVERICFQPSIQAQPQSVTVNQGQTAVLSVSASGTSLFYQWYQGVAPDNSRPVAGGNDDTLFVSPAATTSYWVEIWNECGFLYSDTATVTVNIGCGPDGTSCGEGRTCQGNQCVCTDCNSPVCCGTAGNTWCDGQQHFDPNTGYTGACTSSLPGCGPANDFDGDNEVYHNGDIWACVKYDGAHQWFPRRPSPRCQEVSPVCGYLCAYNFGGGMGFQCEDNGFWSQNPPLPYCYGGTIPSSFLCQ